MTTKAFAPAKINLTLHVTGQRSDGYHLLDSLVVFADVGDDLTLQPGRTMALDVAGPFAEGVPTDDTNLAWRAAVAAGWTGHISLVKNLPHGGGIGGGSSDAAAVLRAVGGVDAAGSLGADVPVCIAATAQRMTGIGEGLVPLPDLPEIWGVLATPPVSVATPEVFAALASKDNAPMLDLPSAGMSAGRFIAWLGKQRNDLQQPAIGICPQIAEVLAVLSALEGSRLARMSGSGATCFALLETQDEARRAAVSLAQSQTDWWVRAVCLS